MEAVARRSIVYGVCFLGMLAFASPSKSESAAPDFSLGLIDGGAFRLADQKGKVVVIDFWATWCGPCMRALPGMSELEKQFKNQNVVFLGISRDRPGEEDKVRQTLEQFGIGYACGIDVDNIASSYGVRGIPSVVVIDQTGVIRAEHVGYSKKHFDSMRGEVDALLVGRSSGGKSGSSGSVDEQGLVKEWESMERTESGHTYSSEKITFRIPSRYHLAQTAAGILVFDASTGERVGSVPLSADKFGNEDRHPEYFYLKDSYGDVLVSVTNERIVAGSSAGKKKQPQKTVVLGYSQGGKVIWDRAVEGIMRPYVLPVSSGHDVMFLSGARRFLLIDSTGKEILDKKIAGPNDRLEVADRDGNGSPEFYFIGKQIVCYELNLPK